MTEYPSTRLDRARLPYSQVALGGLALTLLSVLVAVLSGSGHRFGWWHFTTGFMILAGGVGVALVGSLASLWGVFVTRPGTPRRGLIWALVGLVLGIVVIFPPVQWYLAAQKGPSIHDITTDTQNPPTFKAVVSLRKEAPNAAAYGGAKVAAQQRAGYPELGPASFSEPTGRVFEQALAVARAMGWKVVAAEPETGRVEATDTTFWFGFKDDVVVRIRPQGEATRVDVRSASRVGQSDLGTNAHRIRAFLRALKERI